MQKLFGYANRLLQQLSVWLVSDDLGGEDAGYGGPGLVWLYVVCGSLDGQTNSLKCLWRWLMVDICTFNSRATALVDIPPKNKKKIKKKLPHTEMLDDD